MKDPNIINIKAVNSLQKGKAIIHPRPNPYGGYFGVKPVSDNEKLNLPFVITPDTSYELRHNMTINLADPYQRACWEFIQHEPILAMNAKDAQDREHEVQFYVDDEEKEVEEAATVLETKLKLSVWVQSLNPFEKRELCSLLDYNTAYVTDAHVVKFLLSKINGEDKGYQQVAERKVWMSNGYGRKIMLAKSLIDKNVVKKGGKYIYWNDQAIAEDITSLILWIDKPENADHVRMMLVRLKGNDTLNPVSRKELDYPLSVSADQRYQNNPAPTKQKSSLDEILNEFDKENQEPETSVYQVPDRAVNNPAISNLAAELNAQSPVPPPTLKRPGRPKAQQTEATQVQQESQNNQTIGDEVLGDYTTSDASDNIVID